MSKIHFDCELMLQPFPERLLTDAESFHVLQDAEARPIILCIASNLSLLMIAPDELGQNQIVNLSEKLNLTLAIRSLAVTQDYADANKIYLVLATGAQNQAASYLHILQPFQIGNGSWWERIDWQSLMMKPMNDGGFEVHKLLLASRCDKGQDFPFLAAETAISGVPKHNVSLVKVDTALNQWQWESDSSVLPFDVSKIDCLCVASSLFTSGILYLDKTQGQPTVTFTDLRTTSGPAFFYNLPILPNPTSIATITDPNGASDVLIAGDGGILHVPAQDWIESVPVGTTLKPTLDDPAFRGAHELHVAQDGLSFRDLVQDGELKLSSTVWAINGDGHVVGQNTRLMPREDDPGVLDLEATGKAIPLFPTNDAIRHFEAIKDAKSGRRQLFVLKTGGSVTWFDQAGDSDLWSCSDLCIPDVEEIKDVTAYTCQIQCIDQEGAPLPNTELRISTSTQVRGAIDGEVVYLGETPRPVQTDDGGNITIIFPSSDLVVPTITISGPGLPERSFRPADKVIKKLSTLAQNGKLKDARNKDGSPLFPNLNEEAAKSIGDLHNAYIQQDEATFELLAIQNGESWSSSDWGFLQGLVSGVEKVVDFVCEAGRFIVKTAKKAWNFIVRTAEQALKAISSVFEWIGAKIEDALIWLAEQLDWESIMDVQLLIKSLVLTGLNCVEDMVSMGSEQLDHVLELAEKEVGSWHSPPAVPKAFANQHLEADPEKDKDKANVMSNPMYTWAQSKLQDKQVRKSMDVKGSQSSTSNIFDMIFEKLLKPLWETLGDTAEKIWEDLKKLCKSGSTLTMGDIFKNVGVDLLIGVIRAIRTSASFLFEVIIKIVSLFRSVLNTKLNIYVLTKLYKRVSGGDDLTFLNLACLVVSVPTTYLFKLFTLGKKPRSVPAFATLLSELRSSSTSFDFLAPKKEFDPSVAYLESGHLPEDLDRKSSATWGGEHIATTIHRKVKNNPNLSTFVRICRGGTMVTSFVMPFWTAYDTITTSKSWSRALDREGLGEGISIFQQLSPTIGLVGYFVTLGTSGYAVFQKTNPKRDNWAIGMRWSIWLFKSSLNLIKLKVPKEKKPHWCLGIAVVDIVGYSCVLCVEEDQEETDTVLEALQRYLEDAWALGSYFNCLTRGGQPQLRVATLAAGGVMTVSNLVAAGAHVIYYSNHSEDDDYKPPSWSNSLSGSLS
ncbi:hypothetical protein FANTH_1423 [Fusarium anthophilum]|uniref:Uncharacterized protein n=1 Tax=Fusarium anthophilum TaxID=48485 RepID=A0A8H5EBH0_9HYPO|nr:hypothetical protein FANTH_1423 [Fusarium anthophilum]